MAIIEANRLHKRYGETRVLDGLELSVPEGTVYGFLGPNGAGKTTTMQICTALTQPTSGNVSVANVPVTDRDRLLQQIGYLPEVPPVYRELTAREQLELAAGLQDLPTQYARDRIETLLERLELHGDADTQIADFSKGMRQKTAFIQAMLHDPAVLFLDEPTAGLDPRAGRTLRSLIREFADEGTTVFLSTHVLPVVEDVADIAGVLYDGRLVAEGPPDVLADRAHAGDNSTLEDAFLELTSGDTDRPVVDSNG